MSICTHPARCLRNPRRVAWTGSLDLLWFADRTACGRPVALESEALHHRRKDLRDMRRSGHGGGRGSGVGSGDLMTGDYGRNP